MKTIHGGKVEEQSRRRLQDRRYAARGQSPQGL